jgi:hypothetical protein
MQNIGGKEDMELNSKDLSLSSPEQPVEALGHCRPVGLDVFSPRVARLSDQWQSHLFSLVLTQLCCEIA